MSSLNAGLLRMMEEVRAATVKECALKYGFSEEEAMTSLGMLSLSEGSKKQRKKEVKTKTEKREKPSVPLPFKGSIQEGCCNGLKQKTKHRKNLKKIIKKRKTIKKYKKYK